MRRHHRPRAAALALALLCLPTLCDAEPQVTGEAVYKSCRGCHGERAMGGGDGRYPRLAGLPRVYIERQLKAFKGKRRINKPMIPIFMNYRFDDDVIGIIAAYIATRRPASLNLWPYAAPAEAVASYGSKQAFAEAGAASYDANCAWCHGDDGRGTAEDGIPPLVNQYPSYLSKQMDDFAAGTRRHADARHCGSLGGPEREALLHQVVELGKDAP